MSDASLSTRRYPIRMFLFAGAFLLIGQAFYIQLVDETFAKRGISAGIDKVTIYPSRGLMYDRNGKLLVNNIPVYDLMVVYNQLNPEMDTTKFCQLLGISKATFKKNIEKNWRSPQYSKVVPFLFKSKIAADTFARFQESLYEFPGFFPQVRNIRAYPYPNGAHVLGYIRETNQKEVKDPTLSYRLGDYIGGAGLEKTYEKHLRGEKGVQFIWKDRFGRELGSYKEGSNDTLPVSGKDLVTTIDVELQAYGEYLMGNKTGSIVAIQPKTGEILAMISMPTYDPNLLIINNNRGKVYQELLQNPNLPFFDRAVMAKYPPGSIFKTIVALAGLQEGLIYPSTSIACNEGYYYNNRLYGCHSHPHPGNVSTAIAHSCNSYFWQTFRKLIDKIDFYNPQQGLKEFNQYVYQFGLGNELGIDFPGEEAGNVPTPQYYDKVYKGGGWKSPTIMSYGIGQGELQMTSIQMANLVTILANRGYYRTPHLVKGFRNDTTQIDAKYQKVNQVFVDQNYFDLIADGMERVVTSGTARSAFIWDIPIAGKTGTAQNPHGEDHSVFFGFAPKNDPEIAIVAFVENAGWGATYAAPIASLMIEKYLSPTDTIRNSRKWLEKQMVGIDLVAEP